MAREETTRMSTTDYQLRVSEALPRDVGRGIVRLDPEDLRQLGLSVGGGVAIVGKRETVARAMPAYAEARGQSLIQMDGILRANAGVGLDERVTLRPINLASARSLTLTPLDDGAGQLARQLARLLDGIPVTAGDQVRVELLGSRSLTFRVAETNPAGPVLIGTATTVRVTEARRSNGKQRDPQPGMTTYEDIGGLRREVRRIREMIELPLRFPEVFERLGIDPPKGVLLHGPPGCGKTLIARAVAHETNAHFISVNGPEVIDKLYGASEANLRGVFEEARKKAPAIIFFDEIDAIAPRREDMSGDRQVERRVVAQLLALMDGLESRGNVIVIAATNIPNTLDPALRRPGRFDREIAISVPDAEGRQEIMEIHTRGMPLAEDVNLSRLAQVTHGFVGADLEALSREAAMGALRRMIPALDFGSDLPYDQLMALHVTNDDFLSALAEIEPSAVREVFTDVPDVSWDDVGGLEEIKQLLIETVEWPLRHDSVFRRVGVRPPKGILLYGAPGTGKTLLAKALARQSEANFIAVKGPQLLNMYVGESERAVREVFRKARQAAPCIIFFDEIDALVPRREAGSQVAERVVGQFLTEMDGIEELKGVVVLAATNRPDRVDPALLRPGRFDVMVELPLPDDAARLAILQVHTRNNPLDGDVDLEALAAACAGFAGAEIEGICRRAAMLAVREYLGGNSIEQLGDEAGPASSDLPAEAQDDDRNLRVGSRHFTAALNELALYLRDRTERGHDPV